MWGKMLLAVSVLVVFPLAAKAQQKSAEERYRKEYEGLVVLMSTAKSEGVFLAATKMGGVPELKARTLTDLLHRHNVKYDVQCHMESLQEYSVEVRNAAYQELEDGGQYGNMTIVLTALWTPLVSNGTDAFRNEYFRMQKAADKFKQDCLRDKRKQLELELSQLGLMK